MKRAMALFAAVLVGQFTLSACGNSDNAATPTRPSENKADVQFASEMIPHHGQAIEMAEQALDKTSNAEVRKLALAIKDAQAPEIEKMSDWLRAWDEPVPESSMDMSEMSGHEAHMGMEGMMSADQMAALDEASGTEFDRLWLESMIEHHEGAVEASEEELDSGRYPAAKKLARAIIKAQNDEIATMEALLPKLD